MIDLYYAPTPNGWKISIMLEECGLPYTVIPVNLGKGEQFKPDFLKISPNNRMPAIVDHDGIDGEPVSVFESGAILMYLGEKSGQFFSQDARERVKVLEWLFWQIGGLGPMAGQVSHFVNYAPNFPGDHSYSEKRYKNEYDRLLGIMDNVLSERDYLIYIHHEAKIRFDGGMEALEACKDIDLKAFSTWGDSERIAVNINSLYREFKGEEQREDITLLFTQMAELAKNN